MTPCPACAKDVDPLRAGHVAIFDERFYYFCDRACRNRVAPLGHFATQVGAAPVAMHEPSNQSIEAPDLAERRSNAKPLLRNETAVEQESTDDEGEFPS